MNIAWSTLVIFTVVLSPGGVALWRFQNRTIELSDEIRRVVLVAGAILAAALFHTVWIATCLLCPFFPIPDLDLVYGICIGLPLDDIGTLNDRILGNLPWIITYFATVLPFAAWVGRLVGDHLLHEATPDELDLYLFPGSEGLWSMVDVFVESGMIYRGLFHSRSENMNGDRTLNLALVTKRPPDNSEDGPRQFIPVLRRVSVDEITELVIDSISYDVGLDDETAVEKAGEILGSSNAINEFLRDAINHAPQLIIPWSRIRNLNIRPFIIDQADEAA